MAGARPGGEDGRFIMKRVADDGVQLAHDVQAFIDQVVDSGGSCDVFFRALEAARDGCLKRRDVVIEIIEEICGQAAPDKLGLQSDGIGGERAREAEQRLRVDAARGAKAVFESRIGERHRARGAGHRFEVALQLVTRGSLARRAFLRRAHPGGLCCGVSVQLRQRVVQTCEQITGECACGEMRGVRRSEFLNTLKHLVTTSIRVVHKFCLLCVKFKE